MFKMAISFSFLKESSREREFCKTCTLKKQHKMNSQESTIDIISESAICLYADLFGKGNTLFGVRSFQKPSE